MSCFSKSSWVYLLFFFFFFLMSISTVQLYLNSSIIKHCFSYRVRLPWWLNGRESTCKCGRLRFSLWVEKTPWRRKWQPTPVFLPGKTHGQGSLAGYSLWGHKSVQYNLTTKQQQEKKVSRQLDTKTHAVYLVLFKNVIRRLVQAKMSLIFGPLRYHLAWIKYDYGCSG